MEHTLPSGATISLRPVQDLKSRDRDVWDDAQAQAMGISASYGADDVTISDVKVAPATLHRLPRRALLCRLLTGWSYELPRPAWAGGIENEESFAELPLDDEDAIYELLEPYVVKVGQKPDPKGRRGATTTKSSSSSKATGAPGSPPA